MLISVIIPHYDQPEYLSVCLESLHRQKKSSADIEILVVDNGSRELPLDVCDNHAKVQLLLQKKPGPGPARNLGVERARGEILAFIDADCHADGNWIAAIEEAFSNPDRRVIGGDVQVKYALPEHPTFVEPYERIYAYRNKKYVAQGFSGTGNLAMRAEVFRNVGPFAGLGVAEDRDWGLRAKARGYTTIYVNDMIVYHPARKSFAELTLKWDRHLAHDYAEYVAKPFGRSRWLLRAIAVAGSPVLELFSVLRTKRLQSVRERGLAFLCLSRIRLYRARKMMQMAFVPARACAEGDWSR